VRTTLILTKLLTRLNAKFEGTISHHTEV